MIKMILKPHIKEKMMNLYLNVMKWQKLNNLQQMLQNNKNNKKKKEKKEFLKKEQRKRRKLIKIK